MPLDLSADQAVLDGLETVTLYMSDPDAERVYEDAYRLPERLAEGEPTEGGYLQAETTWHLPTTEAAIDPKPGDLITAGGVDWVIQEVRAPKFGDYWGLACRRSSITADTTDPSLQDQVTLYPGVDAIDTYGSKITTHTAADGDFSTVAAKIKLRASTADDRFGQRQFAERYDIYVDTALPQLHNGDVIKDQTGKVYTVLSWRNRELIDELSVIECELRITPRT